MLFETRCAGCDTPGPAICTTCRFALLGRPPHDQPDGVIAVLPFTGRTRAIVLNLKYRNRRAAARHLAGLVVNRLIELGEHHDLDVVTWAPTSRRRRRERGFDQAELIASTVARQLGLPCRRLLERADERSGTQTGRDRTARLVAAGFVARPGLDGLRALVVDDVVTTGATLRAAADALASRGATATLVALAATPDRRRSNVVALPGRTSSAA